MSFGLSNQPTSGGTQTQGATTVSTQLLGNQQAAIYNNTVFVNSASAATNAFTYVGGSGGGGSTGGLISYTNQPTQIIYGGSGGASWSWSDLWRELVRQGTKQKDGSTRIKIPMSLSGKIELETEDGTILCVDDVGRFQINDKHAKVIYKASRVREFNKFLNASDLLAKFVQYLDTMKVKRSEVMGLPIELFIKWLVIESARADQEPVMPEDEQALIEALRDKIQLDATIPDGARPLMLPAPRRQQRCGCGRFLSHERVGHGLLFCSGAHMDHYELVRMGART